MSEFWTQEKTDALIKLWSEGESASSVAAILGAKSRSAVLGKVHRLKLPERPKDRQTSGFVMRSIQVKRRDAIVKVKPKPAPVPFKKAFIAPNGSGRRFVSLLDLEDNHCRYPFTQQDGTHLFCGNDKLPGISYCAHCAPICFSVPVARPTEAKAQEREKETA